MGFSRLLSMSADRSVRIVNLSTQKLEQVVKTNKDYYSGCQIDWNTVLLGGVSKTLDMMDIRCKKMIYSQGLDFPVLQICEMVRLTDREVFFSNVNQLYSVDLRTFRVTARGVYDGERVSKIKAIS